MASKKSKKIGIYDSCINEYVYDEVPEGSHCLDVGCWTGNLGKKLIKEKKCRVDGIDFNSEALTEAKDRGYQEVFNINLNCNPQVINKIKKRYDCIICADVLEHLNNPELVLSLLMKKMKKDGIIISFVPNIGFAKQRVELLFGKFEYNLAGGIMDKTHLRFFTAKSLCALYEQAGFRVESFSGYSLVKNKYFFLRFLAKIWPSLFALQFLVKVKLKNTTGIH